MAVPLEFNLQELMTEKVKARKKILQNSNEVDHVNFIDFVKTWQKLEYQLKQQERASGIHQVEDGKRVVFNHRAHKVDKRQDKKFAVDKRQRLAEKIHVKQGRFMDE